jgi:hypothetical protein
MIRPWTPGLRGVMEDGRLAGKLAGAQGRPRDVTCEHLMQARRRLHTVDRMAAMAMAGSRWLPAGAVDTTKGAIHGRFTVHLAP